MTAKNELIQTALDSARARLLELGKDASTERVMLEALRTAIDDLSAMLPVLAADHIRYLTLPPELRRGELGFGEMEFEIRNLAHERAVAKALDCMIPVKKKRFTRAETVVEDFLDVEKMKGSDRLRLWKIVFGYAQRHLPEKATAAISGRHRDTCRIKLKEHLGQLSERHQRMSSYNF